MARVDVCSELQLFVNATELDFRVLLSRIGFIAFACIFAAVNRTGVMCSRFIPLMRVQQGEYGFDLNDLFGVILKIISLYI